jgi:repressor LexA
MTIILYKKQRQIVDYIFQYIQKFGYSPTLSEIAEAINVSALSTVCGHLDVLERKKIVRRYKGALRGIELLGDNGDLSEKGLELPILGYIAAGQPIEPYTDPEATAIVPQQMVSGKKRAFVLQVKGESMIEEGILDGDYIVVEEQAEVKNGDIVVAILENGFATLKKFYKEASRIRLEPANATMKPIFVNNVTVQGRAVGVIRNWNGGVK